MFPDLTFMLVVAAFAALVAPLFPFSGVRGFIKQFIVCILLLYGLVGAGVLLGMIFHSAVFGEPVITP